MSGGGSRAESSWRRARALSWLVRSVNERDSKGGHEGPTRALQRLREGRAMLEEGLRGLVRARYTGALREPGE